MSISFNINDDHLALISQKSALTDVETKNSYRIYGLIQSGENPPILIEHNNIINKNTSAQLIKLFKKKGAKLEILPLKEKCKHNVYIGIRSDYRVMEKFTIAAIQTIIHSLEGKIKKRVKKVVVPNPTPVVPQIVQEIH